MMECSCGRKCLEFIGPEDSDILIVSDAPEDDDYKKGMIFTGQRGQILASELARVGIQMSRIRLACFYLHAPADDCAGHFNEALKEMKNKKGVLIVGASAVERMQLGKLSDMVGTCVDNFYVPRSTGFVMVTTQPPANDLLGEFRLSVEKFSKKIKEVKRD